MHNQILLPNNVKYIIHKLEEAGHEAYAVGGCIRDSLMGIMPYDWDITTSAHPMKIKELFKRTVDTGLKHGTVTVLIGDDSYEVTTYRIDGEYEDYRRPLEVSFTDLLQEDLKRRDFTINAMAYNEKQGLVDLFGGVRDIEEGIVRCVGNPKERFREDALRMLRAIRFAARFGFKIHEETRKAIIDLSQLIVHISSERIFAELTKILVSDHPEYMEYLYSMDLLDYVIPEFLKVVNLHQNNPYHIYSVDQHTYQALKAVKSDKVLRWAVYLHDIGKGITKTTGEDGFDHFYGHPEQSVRLAGIILNRLKADNKTIRAVTKLIEFHDYRPEPTEKAVKKLLYRLGEGYFYELLMVQEADIAAQKPELFEERKKLLQKVKGIYEKIKREEQCFSLKDLKITGSDLIKNGIAEGKLIGAVLNRLLELVIEAPDMNTQDLLIAKAIEIKNQLMD